MARSVGKARSTIHFADLNGDGLDDYLSVDPSTGAVTMWQNRGSVNGTSTIRWTPLGIIANGAGAGAGVFFADMDGDGKDDYVWIDVNGAAALWLNGGVGEDGKWIWISKGKIAAGVGGTRDEIRLADIDGDGKADYLLVNKSTGVTNMWKNGGMGSDGRWIWASQEEVASGGGPAGSSIRFADLGGTGRSDYLDIRTNPLGAFQWLSTCVNRSRIASNTSINPSNTININRTATGTRSTNVAGVTNEAVSPKTSTSSAGRCLHVENMLLAVLLIVIIL